MVTIESIFKERYDEFIRRNSLGALEAVNVYNSSMLAMPEMENIYEQKKYEQYKEEVASKTNELSYYKNLLNEKLSLLATNEEIPSMKNNLLILFLFSLTSVFFPLGMMLFDSDTMIKYRALTFGIMLIGWLVVVGNLSRDIWSLMDKSPEPDIKTE